jgi:hypothetical protein
MLLKEKETEISSLDKDYWQVQEKRFMEFKKKFHNEFYINFEKGLFVNEIIQDDK